MTIQQLYDNLKDEIETGNGDTEVVIRTTDPSLIVSSSVGINSVGMGFDWDSGTYFINPDKSLVIKE